MTVCVFMFRWFVLARGVADSSLSHRKGEHRALCHGWGSPVAAEIPSCVPAKASVDGAFRNMFGHFRGTIQSPIEISTY